MGGKLPLDLGTMTGVCKHTKTMVSGGMPPRSLDSLVVGYGGELVLKWFRNSLGGGGGRSLAVWRGPPPPPQKPCEATVLLHDVVLVPQQQAYQSEVVWVGVSPELSSTLEWTPSSLEQGAGRGHQLHRQTENTLQHA